MQSHAAAVTKAGRTKLDLDSSKSLDGSQVSGLRYWRRLISFRIGGPLRGRLCFVRRIESGLHFFHGLRKLLRVVVEVQEKAPYIEGRARKLAKRGGEWRAARAADCGDVLRQMNRIHAATGKRLMRVLHQPDAVVAVYNHVCGNDCPLSIIRLRGPLAIPDLRLRHDHGGVVKAPLIQVNLLQSVLIGKPLHLGEGLIPVEIGIVNKGIGGMPETECIDVRKVVGVGVQSREKATQSQHSGHRPYEPACSGNGTP